MADSTHEKGKMYCSFCGKNDHEVAKLIAGPSVLICDECVGVCVSILKKEPDLPQDLKTLLGMDA